MFCQFQSAIQFEAETRLGYGGNLFDQPNEHFFVELLQSLRAVLDDLRRLPYDVERFLNVRIL